MTRIHCSVALLVAALAGLSALEGVVPISSATASSTALGSVAAAFDSNPTTTWVAAADEASGAVFTLDLGTAAAINAVSLVPTVRGRSFRWESSVDGTTWTTVLDRIQALTSLNALGDGSALPANTAQLAVARTFAPVTARWWRLTCLTLRSGESCGLAELQVALDPAYAALGTRLATIQAQVTALTGTTATARLHKALLTWAVEDAGLDRDAARFTAATTTLDEVVTRLPSPVAVATTAPTSCFPAYPGGTANPFATRGLAAATALRSSTTRFPRGEESADIRKPADEALTLISALGHPQAGSLEHDPDLLVPALRRLQAIVDQADPDGTLDDLDFFAKSSFATAALQCYRRYPGLLLPGVKTRWDAVFRSLGTVEAARSATATKVNNVNQEALKWWAMTCAGLAFDDATVLAQTSRRMDQFTAVMFPDGAFPYSDLGNEANEYQAVALRQFDLFSRVTGDARGHDLIRRTRWYFPLTCRRGPMAEWNTSHIAKDRWNGVSGADGAYLVAALTGCPDNYRVATEQTINYGDVLMAPHYRTDLTARAEPDDWVTTDRNVRGTRGRSGDFSFWTNGNTSNQTNSLAGSMILNPGSGTGFTCNAAVAGLGAYVRRALGPTVTATEHEANLSWYGERGGAVATLTTPRFGTIAGQHGISQGLFQPTQDGWRVQEQWLVSPTGQIGLIAVEATTTTQAFGLGTMVKLFSRRTAGTRKTWSDLGGGSWAYGDLRVTVHASTFADAATDYSWCHTWDGTTDGLGAGRLLLRDAAAIAADAGTASASTTYLAGTRRYALIEIRPTTVAAPAVVTALPALPGGLMGFETDRGTGQARVRVIHNPTTRPVRYDATLAWGGPVWRHRSGGQVRAAWMEDYDTSAFVDPRGSFSPSGAAADLCRDGLVAEVIPAGAQLVLERDLTVPAAPTGLLAVAGGGGVTVRWTSASTNETAFVLERSSGGAFSTVATLGAGIDQAVDATGTAGMTYRVVAQAVGGSSTSTTVVATTGSLPVVVPTAPTSLRAMVISATRIDLTWADVARDIGYRVERRTTGAFVTVATLASGVTTWSDTTLTALTSASYWVVPLGTSGDGPASAEVAATTFANAAAGVAVTASSGTTAAQAVDGNFGTVWTSVGAGTQSLTLTLGGAYQDLSRVRLTWGATFATASSLAVSDDGATFTTVADRPNGVGGTEIIDLVPTVRARFLRLTMTASSGATYQVAEIEALARPTSVTTPAWGGSVKQDNAVALDDPASWTNAAVPMGVLATWDAMASSSARITSVGAGLAPSGLVLNGAAGDVTLTPGTGALSLGAAGLDTTWGEAALVVQAPVVLAADQTWRTASTAGATQITVGGVVSGTGRLTVSGGRAVALMAANTASGGMAVEGGTLVAGSPTALGTGHLSLGATGGSATATLVGQAGNGGIFTNDLVLGTTTGDLTIATAQLSGGNRFNGVITGSNDLRFGAPGLAGVVVLGGDSSATWTGHLRVVAGTLKLAAGSVFAPTSLLDIAAGATVDLNASGTSWTFAALTGAGTLDNAGGGRTIRLTGSGTSTFTGPITRNIVLQVALGIGGVQRLEGASTFVGNASSALTITGGTLEVTTVADAGVPSALGQAAAGPQFLRLDGGTLRWVGTAPGSTNRGFQVGQTTVGGTATIEASGATGAPVTFTATALGFGTTNQTRHLVLGGTNTGANTLAAALANNGTGALSVTKSGTGRWMLSGAASHTGPLAIEQGTLQVGAATALASTTALTIASGAVLDLNGFSVTVASLRNDGAVTNTGTTSATLTVLSPAQVITVAAVPPTPPPGPTPTPSAGSTSGGSGGCGLGGGLAFLLALGGWSRRRYA